METYIKAQWVHIKGEAQWEHSDNMIREIDLRFRMKKLIDKPLRDVLIIMKEEYSDDVFALYYHKNKVILIYSLDENGDRYSDAIIERECLHELAHHVVIQSGEYNVDLEDAHGKDFKIVYKKLLDKYYGDNKPAGLIDYLTEVEYIEIREPKGKILRRVQPKT